MYKCLQINIGRGKEATHLMERHSKIHGIDIILLQEPYKNHQTLDGYKKHNMFTNTKSQIWTKQNSNWETRIDLCTENITTIELANKDDHIRIVNIYDEPGGKENSRFSEKSTNWENYRTAIVIAGDLNAKNEAWGGHETDERGQKLLEWTASNGFEIINDINSPPTFDSNRGKSWIDVTMCKNTHVINWEVLECETLSDHRYVMYSIPHQTKTNFIRHKRKFNFDLVDWKIFQLRMQKALQIITQTKGETLIENHHKSIELQAIKLQQHCTQVVKSTIPTITVKQTIEQEDWWNGELQQTKVNLKRLRKVYQDEANDEERARKLTSYKKERNAYKKLIKAAKIKSVNDQLENNVDSNPWNKVWSLIAKRQSATASQNIEKEDGTFTKTKTERDTYLLQKYFPQDLQNNDSQEQKQIRTRAKNYNIVYEEPITAGEIKETIATLKKGTAMAEERIPNEAMEHIAVAIGDQLAILYNECLQYGYFPRVWKKANIVWIPKKGNSLRPISLLPTLGKVLDKLLNRRLQTFLEQHHKLSPRQFGFRAGRSTVDAITFATEKIKENKKNGMHSLVMALDIANAFNAAWGPYIDKEMETAEVPKQLRMISQSFLEGRIVKTGSVQRAMERGCPQGSSLGPTLWLVVMEGWFRKMKEANEAWKAERAEREQRLIESVQDLCTVQAFADDQLIIIAANSARKIEEKWDRVWETCLCWQKESKLQYNTAKTEAMFVDANKKIRKPVINLSGHRPEVKDSLKYLGVIVDCRMNYIEHIKECRKKSGELATKLYGITRRKWGNNKDILKTIYKRAIKPAIIYGHQVWGHRIQDSRTIRHLEAIQRLHLLPMTKTYKTTATESLFVLTGIPPLQIEIACTRQVNMLHEKSISWERTTKRNAKLKLPANETEEEFLQGEELVIKTKRKGMIAEQITANWQARWSSSLKGRKLYESCEEVGYDMMDLSKKATQLITDHGNMNGYLYRFRLRDSGTCDCGLGETEDKDHIMYRCIKRNRSTTREQIKTTYGDLKLQLRRDGKVDRRELQKINEWAESTIEDEQWD